ncbi:MAG: hypothetical protein KKC66_00125 [Candidatus Omnitrophica bacterium]|nr:hypothetical protein [Candidatus Omnitrophota bacterium]MBU1932298.1 hypothetical protein [Candidatus Omnitrophota bacterium]
MMHKEIGDILGISRPTITRWFKKYNIPSKSCHRFTNRNLTNWPYIIGIKKKKVKGPDKRIQRTKGNINVDFFKSWSEEMAYVLGYFSADGGMFINSGGSKYIQFVSTDYSLLEKVKKAMDSKHKIYLKRKGNKIWKDCYLLEIGSKEIYNDLLNLGLLPKKAKRLKLPQVPKQYFNHFIRGYFDGDGCISYGFYKKKGRSKKGFKCTTYFISSSKEFLKGVSKKLKIYAGIGSGSISKHTGAYDLTYSKNDTLSLFNYMYNNIGSDLFLERKYKKFQDIFRILGQKISA